MAVNKVILIGNVGNDPKITHLDGGVSLAQFPLATSESYTDRNSGEKKETTEWHNIVCWNNLADIVGNYVKKGAKLYIEGKMRTRSWDDDNGVKHYITEVVVINLQMLDRRENGGGNRAPLPEEEPQGRTRGRRSDQSLTEAAAAVTARQRGAGAQLSRDDSDRQHTEPRIKPEEIKDDSSDDLPF